MDKKISKFISVFIFLGCYLIMLFSFCQAGSIFDFGTKDVGTNSGEFLKIGMGARPCGMGGVFVSVADDSNAIYWNPAGLGMSNYPEVSLMHLEWFGEVDYDSLSYIRPTGLGTLGINMVYLQKRGIEKTKASPDGRYYRDGTFSFADMGLTLSLGRKLNNNFYYGGNFKIIREEIDEAETYGMAVDGGILYLYHSLSLGFVVQNMGTGLKFGEERFSLPFSVRGGGSYKLLQNNLIVGLEGELPRYGRSNISLGAEYRLFDVLAFRVGYKYIDGGWQIDELNGMTGGIGVRLSGSEGKRGSLGLDYAFAPYGDFGNTHRISMSYKWGGNIEPVREDKEEDIKQEQKEETENLEEKEEKEEREIEELPKVKGIDNKKVMMNNEQAVKTNDKKNKEKIIYQVIKGDCLWKIAGKKEIYANSRKWKKIYQANKDKIKNPDLIYTGQKLIILRQETSTVARSPFSPIN